MSVEGYRHRRDGVPCQDAWRSADIGPSRDGAAVLAVADGAGSRPRSDEGAKLAVHLATRCFGRRLPASPSDASSVHKFLLSRFHEVREEFFRQTGRAAQDFATTLTVVLLTRSWLSHLSVGDGFVVVRAGTEDGERQFHLLPRSDSISEYSNETVFLTSREADRWVETTYVRDAGIDGVLLSTDGLAQTALSWWAGRPQAPNRSFMSAVFRSLDTPGPAPAEDEEVLAALLRSDALTAVNADDKTLLRAVRS